MAREVKKTIELEIYTDGGCMVHLSKKGSYSFVVVEEEEVVYEMSDLKHNTTNSEMEILALLNALKFAINQEANVTIYSDSSYCVNSYNSWAYNWERNGWKKSNKKAVAHEHLWREIHALRGSNIKVKWVKGHSDNKWNCYADSLCSNTLNNAD